MTKGGDLYMKFDTLITEPLIEMMVRVANFIPTLLIALGILIIGCMFAHGVQKLITRIFKSIEFDKVSDTMGLTKSLRQGGVHSTPSSVVGCLTYWVLMVMVLILTVKSLGLSTSGLIDKLLAYIPSVIAGAVYLVIGMLLAKFVATIVYIVAKGTDMPIPKTIAKLTKLSIVVFVAIVYLKEIGFVSLFVGMNYTIFMAGLVFAVALAFGLAGKEVAAKYLHVFDKK